MPPWSIDDSQQQRVVAGERRRHGGGARSHSARRAHDVGEQERDHAARRLDFGRLGERQRRGAELVALLQHCSFELAELDARLDAELVGEGRAQLLVGAQGLGLPPTAVEGDDPLAPQAFAQRVLGAQRLELAGELVVPPTGQVGFDPVFEGAEPFLFEAGRIGADERRARQLAERRASPQRQRFGQEPRRLGGVAIGSGRPAAGHQRLEPDGVDRVGHDGQQVATRSGLDEVVGARGERLAQPRHVRRAPTPRRALHRPGRWRGVRR